MPYAELCHYEFTSRGREEANEEKLVVSRKLV